MAKPGAHGKDKQRCGARVKRRCNWHGGPAYCRRWPVDGQFGRCHLHGGYSTGPKTREGKAQVVAAMVAGRKRWLEKLKAEGQKVPCGRKAKKMTTKLKQEIQAVTRPSSPIEPDEEFCYAPGPPPAKWLMPDPLVSKALAVLRKLESEGF